MMKSFKELMDNIFYDWGYTYGQGSEITKRKDGSFNINKTDIFFRDDKYLLTYKTDCSEISNELFENFNKFYEFYKDDSKFEDFLTIIGNYWYPQDTDFSFIFNDDSYKLNNSFMIKELSDDRIILQTKDNKYNEVISKDIFDKFVLFYNLCQIK